MGMLEPIAQTSIPLEDEALRADVRSFLATHMPPLSQAERARSWTAFDADFTKALAARGWVGLTLPTEFGGGSRSQFARFVLIEELLIAGAPVMAHWIAERQSAPLLLRYGTEEQKRRIVPAICRGEAFFCIGMSEPNSGSDLASVRTRAERTEDGWRLSGSKIWTTYGHKAHYMIALVRTSGSPEDRNAGLSQFIVDMATPGVSAKPIVDLSGDEHFSEVHFNDVLLPPDALIGVEGAGWSQVVEELAFERAGPERIYSSTTLIDGWIDYIRQRGHPTDSEKELAGRLLAELAALRNLSLSVTALLGRAHSPVIEASIVKDLGTGFEQAAPRLIAAHLADEPEGSVPADLLAALEYVAGMCPTFSLRGGTREILRGIIARGLGLR